MYLPQTLEILPLKFSYNPKVSNPAKPIYFNQLLYDVAITTLKEAIVCVAMATITSYFVASTAIPLLITSTITLIAFNALVRLTRATALYKLHQFEQSDSDNTLAIDSLKFLIKLSNWICPNTVAFFDIGTTATVIHEAGHAFAARSVHQNANPKIEVFPWEGGATSYRAGPLSNFGKWLGKKNSEILVTAAGPAFGIITATIQIIFSHRLQKDNPEASRALFASALLNIASHVQYAVSALWQTTYCASHDFQRLWKITQIHPLAAVVVMVALPIFAKVVMVGIDRL